MVQYSVISPKHLLKRAQEKTDAFAECLPELLALSILSSDKPSVQFYEGLEGLKMIYEDTLNYPESTLKAFLGYGKLEKGLERYLTYVYLPARVKRKITAQVLMPQERENANYAPMDKRDTSFQRTQIRVVSNPTFQISNEINLYGEDRIALMMFNESEMMGLIIKSKLLYTTLVSLFDLTRERETDA